MTSFLAAARRADAPMRHQHDPILCANLCKKIFGPSSTATALLDSTDEFTQTMGWQKHDLPVGGPRIGRPAVCSAFDKGDLTLSNFVQALDSEVGTPVPAILAMTSYTKSELKDLIVGLDGFLAPNKRHFELHLLTEVFDYPGPAMIWRHYVRQGLFSQPEVAKLLSARRPVEQDILTITVDGKPFRNIGNKHFMHYVLSYPPESFALCDEKLPLDILDGAAQVPGEERNCVWFDFRQQQDKRGVSKLLFSLATRHGLKGERETKRSFSHLANERRTVYRWYFERSVPFSKLNDLADDIWSHLSRPDSDNFLQGGVLIGFEELFWSIDFPAETSLSP